MAVFYANCLNWFPLHFLSLPVLEEYLWGWVAQVFIGRMSFLSPDQQCQTHMIIVAILFLSLINTCKRKIYQPTTGYIDGIIRKSSGLQNIPLEQLPKGNVGEPNWQVYISKHTSIPSNGTINSIENLRRRQRKPAALSAAHHCVERSCTVTASHTHTHTHTHTQTHTHTRAHTRTHTHTHFAQHTCATVGTANLYIYKGIRNCTIYSTVANRIITSIKMVKVRCRLQLSN